MSQSTTIQVSAEELLRLQRRRKQCNQAVLADAPARRRRLALYVRTMPGVDPESWFEPLRLEAARQGWKVGHEIHDDCGPLAPQQSPGWLRARKLQHEGYVDGVLIPDRSHISQDPAEYETELRFACERLCVTALLRPEAGHAETGSPCSPDR
ncbi:MULTISPECIES: hypothetical protein [unclassified Streptomyces]|uniref:hypothetical protein n=1 Tax=unclassified Streptomyces TaxID=2593676 RepID=UPI0038083CBF